MRSGRRRRLGTAVRWNPATPSCPSLPWWSRGATQDGARTGPSWGPGGEPRRAEGRARPVDQRDRRRPARAADSDRNPPQGGARASACRRGMAGKDGPKRSRPSLPKHRCNGASCRCFVTVCISSTGSNASRWPPRCARSPPPRRRKPPNSASLPSSRQGRPRTPPSANSGGGTGRASCPWLPCPGRSAASSTRPTRWHPGP
jgi:hypothetical protein